MKVIERFINRHENLTIISVFILATAVIYGYFWLFSGYKLQFVYQNWDGPSYVVIAKSFYDQKTINQVNTLPLSPKYFAAHFPLYPLTIRLLSYFGYFRAMILSSLLFSLLFILAFNSLAKLVYPKINSLYPSLALIFLTPRWFIVSHVGGSEPLFLFLTTLAIICLKKKKYLLTAILVALSAATRIQGAFFLLGLGFYYLFSVFIAKKMSLRTAIRQILPFMLVPLVLLGIFSLYYFRYGNFFAFFAAESDFHHLNWIPFNVFSSFTSNWANVWKENYLFNYFIYLSAIIVLFRKRMFDLAFIASAFLLPVLFEVHIDVSRYLLPLLPFLFLAHLPVISKKTFLFTLIILIPAIFSFSINFIFLNLSP